MPRSTRFALLLGLVAVAAPAARGDDPAPLTRRQKGDLAIKARAVLRKYCGECHGDAPTRSQLSVLDHNQLVAKGRPVPFVNLDAPPRSQVIEFIEDGSMPPGGRERPTPEEVATLKVWAAARAPSYPRAFDDRTTLAVMLDDLDRQDPAAVPHLRYLSLAHLVRDDQLVPDLKAVEGQLQRALLAASGKSVSPDPVDDTATLFRLDIRALGWDTPDLFDRIEKGQPRPDAYPMVPFDLLLLDYPHAPAVPEKDPLAGRLQSFLGAAKQLRPVPFLRADWVGEALAPTAPLAADLKSLVDLGRTTKKAGPPPCGPRVRPFVGPEPARGRAPLTAWYAGDAAADPAPFGLKVEVIRSDSRPTSEVGVGEAFKLRVVADREVRFVLLTVLATGDVRIQPVDGGTVLKRDEPRSLGSPPAKPFVIASILTGAESATEHFVLVAAEGEVPVPTIVRSRHADAADCKNNQAPVWRFVFDAPAGGFDPARAVRKVVPLTVTRKKP
ncbi:MAG: hypothetical protein JWO38_5906 [Gemmataceae bacterium]|nr:hypothetical protein [Gemmataceae bacterium]